MEKISNGDNVNDLNKNQELLYIKFRKINRLFKIHFSTLALLFVFALGFMILWIVLLITGQATTDLTQRYGFFGTFVTIIFTVLLFILITQIGVQGYIYTSFILGGNRSLKRINDNSKHKTTFSYGIVPYISNFYRFFKRYSKDNKSLVKLVQTFLFINFFSGFYIVFLFTRLVDAEHVNPVMKFVMFLLFLTVLFFWVVHLITSGKIQNEIKKWEILFPKLDEWAQSLENKTLENSNSLEMEL